VGKNRVAIHLRVGNRANAIFAHAATTVHARLSTLRFRRHCERSEAISRRTREIASACFARLAMTLD
jgi:hypothetical protein